VTFEGHFGDLLTVVISCAQLTRELFAIAKFLVSIRVLAYRSQYMLVYEILDVGIFKIVEMTYKVM